MTPLMIEIALHYYTTAPEAGDWGYREGRMNLDAVAEARNVLTARGLLKLSNAKPCLRDYEATDGMRVLVDALCAVPFPEQRWVMPTLADQLAVQREGVWAMEGTPFAHRVR